MRRKIQFKALLPLAFTLIVASCQPNIFNNRTSGAIGLSVNAEMTKSGEFLNEEVLYSTPFKNDNGETFYLTVSVCDANTGISTKGTPIYDANIGRAAGFNQFHTSVYTAGGSTYTDAEGQPMGSVTAQFDAVNSIWELTGHTKDAYYWPDDGSNLTFCSYAPVSATATGGTVTNLSWDLTNKKAFFSYKQPAPTAKPYADAVNQKDLILAIDDHQNKNKEIRDNKSYAQIHFYHALTAVQFTRGKELNDCKILDVTLSNFYSSGNATLDYSITDPKSKFVWTGQDNKQTFRQAYNSTIDDSVERGDDGTSTAGASLDPTYRDADDYNDGEYTFMMIPQLLPDDAMITITVEGRLHPIELAIGSPNTGNAENDSRLKDWSNYSGRIVVLRVESEKMDMVRVAVDDQVDHLIKSDVVTANTGRNGVFMRAALLANGINKDGKIVKPIYIEDISSDSRFALPTGWSTYWEYCTADGFYYYKYVLPSGKKTCVDLFTTFTLPDDIISSGSEASDVKKVQFDVVIQGIDAGPGTTEAPYTKVYLEKAAGYFWPASIVGDISLEGKGI